MLRTTDIYLERLMYLRDVVFPHVEEMQRQGRVNLDEFASKCGTYQCLAGWSASDPHFVRQGFRLRNGHYTRPVFDGLDDLAAVRAFLGLEKSDVRRLFGPSYRGTLGDRKAILDTLITRRAEALAVECSGTAG